MKINFTKIQSKLNSTARIRLACLPTPLEKIKNMRDIFGRSAVYIKRDDLTGHCFGGNKERKLEFFMAEAVKKRATAVVTVGAVQSNHCRMTQAAACALGLKCELILIKDADGGNIEPEGNYFLDKLMGAVIHLVKAAEVNTTINRLMEALKKKGERPYFIPGGGHSYLGAFGHILFMQELKGQLKKTGFRPDYLVLPTGTGTTQAGLILGKLIFGPDINIIGISISRGKERCVQEIAKILTDAEKYLGFEPQVWYNHIHLFDDYIGEKYGSGSKESREALNLLAKREGTILDPIYNAKAFAGMLDLAAKKKISGNIIYLNTGGIPALFTRKFSNYAQ